MKGNNYNRNANTDMAGGFMFTSDWHWGAELFGRSRSEEQYKALDELIEIFKADNLSHLVIGGDIMDAPKYKGTQPILDFVHMVNYVLSALPQAKITIVKGNHDWDGIKAFAVMSDRLSYISEPAITELDEHNALIAVPFMRPVELGNRTYCDVMRDLIEEDRQNNKTPKRYNICCHAAFEGTVPELKDPCVDLTAADLADHVFLGHIHDYGRITDNIYYTGSLIRKTFGEAKQTSGVYIVSPDGRLRSESLKTPMLMRNFSVTVDDVINDSYADMINRFFDATPNNTYIKISVPGAIAYSEKIEETIRKIQSDEHKVGRGEIIKVDYSVKKEKEIPVLNYNKIQMQNPITPKDLRERIKVAPLWDEYVSENIKNEDERHLVKGLGIALLDGMNPSDLWKSMLSKGTFELVNKEADTPNNAEEEEVQLDEDEFEQMQDELDYELEEIRI